MTLGMKTEILDKSMVNFEKLRLSRYNPFILDGNGFEFEQSSSYGPLPHSPRPPYISDHHSPLPPGTPLNPRLLLDKDENPLVDNDKDNTLRKGKGKEVRNTRKRTEMVVLLMKRKVDDKVNNAEGRKTKYPSREKRITEKVSVKKGGDGGDKVLEGVDPMMVDEAGSSLKASGEKVVPEQGDDGVEEQEEGGLKQKDTQGNGKATSDMGLEDNRLVTPTPKQSLSLKDALQSIFSRFAPVLNFENLNSEAFSLLKPGLITESGLTSKESCHIVGAFLTLSSSQWATVLTLLQEDLAFIFLRLSNSKKRKDVKHIKSPEHKCLRRHLATSPSNSPLSSPIPPKASTSKRQPPPLYNSSFKFEGDTSTSEYEEDCKDFI